MHITKTDYLEYTFCKKNLWLKKHKPELFEDVELSDFEKKIIEEGNLADEEARFLFFDCVWRQSHDTKRYHWSLNLISPVDYLIKNNMVSRMMWTNTIH